MSDQRPTMPPHLSDVVPAGPTPTPSRRRAAPRPNPVLEGIRVTVRGFGEVLITLGLVLLLFCGYQLYWTDVLSARETAKELNALDVQFAETPLQENVKDIPPLGKIKNGEVFARMYVPRFGKNWVKPILQDTQLDDLHKGIGHYVDTAMPGQLGNFAVAGHRTTNGHPLRNVDKLKSGDQIFVETKYAWYTYSVTVTNKIVDPEDGYYVVFPTAEEGKPDAKPTESIMTLTSCHPPYSAAERIITHAQLTDTRARGSGPPPGAPVEAA